MAELMNKSNLPLILPNYFYICDLFHLSYYKIKIQLKHSLYDRLVYFATANVTYSYESPRMRSIVPFSCDPNLLSVLLAFRN